ncbi:hypothetical protein [Bradyrhizobium sp. WSM2254]|uniref:hypothetical protein n=1 Tax=Bradyrhizobium sp. WSM2254 TaxID=1188263 RepID=UPI000428DE36|nr:hypothetical protein [Bradyrhizobium sp. WSM2254]
MARNANRSSGRVRTSIDDAASFRRLIHAQGNLAAGLNTHRRAISLENVARIVRALMPNAIYRNLLAPEAFPRTHGRVKGGKFFGTLAPEFELIWAAAVISHYTTELNQYLTLKETYSGFYLRADFNSAKGVLDEVEGLFGLSLWLANARLSLSQVAEGLAAQKLLLNEIVATPSVDPLYAYISFLASYSLEEGVTLPQLRRELVDPSDIREYTVYHVSPFDLDSIQQPHVCISLEGNSPIIDRFETLIDMMLLLHVRDQHRGIVSQAATLLKNIRDRRLSTLNFLFESSDNEPVKDTEFLQACDLYSLGEYGKAADAIDNVLKRPGGSAWAFELAARNDMALEANRTATSIADNIISETRSFLDVSKDLAHTRDALHRLGFQTRKLLASRVVAALLDRMLDLPIADTFSDAQQLASFSSPLVQPAHYRLIKLVDKTSFDKLVSSLQGENSPTHKLALMTLARETNADELVTDLRIPEKRASLYLAYGAYNQGDYPKAKQYFASYLRNAPEKTNPRTAAFEHALYRREQLLGSALRAFVEAYFENPRSHSLYSMAEFCSWAVSKAAADEAATDRAILLHAYSRLYDSTFDGDLSDAFEDILDHFQVDRSSELIVLPIERRRLIYILRFVANIERLEDTTRFDTLDQIESERIAALQWLVKNDAVNRTVYTQEISSITKDQEVARLSAQFERSKIYVHEEGIKRTFDSEIKPQFYRYRQLLSDPDAVAQIDQIEQRIRKLLKESELQFGYLIIPSTERDSIYFAMVQRAYDILVLDPNHGFKTYLSTRILHGILEGELRASFVNEGLLVAVDGANKEQEVLGRWNDRLSSVGNLGQLEIAKNVVKFSERVTQAISHLKDRKVRIFSAKDNPEGLFAISLSVDAFDRLKQSLTSTTTYEEFLDRLIQSFWDGVERCLREVKIEISTRFRRQIVSAFDGIESALISMENDPRPVELLDAVARCRTAFDFNLTRVTAWFSRAGVLTPEPFLAGTAIRLAARITNNCYPQHPLDVATTERGHYEISGELLNPLVDLLTNCFQNAAEHSEIKNRAPTASVTVDATPDNDLVFGVATELAESVDHEACRREIQELLIEREIANPTAVAGEGRTGIRKMKRILRHDFQSDQKLQIKVSKEQVIVSFTVPRRYVSERSYH